MTLQEVGVKMRLTERKRKTEKRQKEKDKERAKRKVFQDIKNL